EQKKKNFDFYDPLTTGDSSLSACIQSIVACEVGYMDKARLYARSAALMDLADVHGNVRDGCHIASMGGFWMTVVYGFAGMRNFSGDLCFNPQIPDRIDGVRFHLTVHGKMVDIEYDRKSAQATYTLLKGDKLNIHHQGKKLSLFPNKPVQDKITKVDLMKNCKLNKTTMTIK
ncbi:hypothetical protein BVX98_07080, partial [bacterium F11]